MIQSQVSNIKYVRGHWTGDVTCFIPGWGYQYYSARTEEIDFFFSQASSTSVTTATPTNVTNVSAEVGGTVSVIEGGQVFLRGVCWDSTPNPDFNSNHTLDDLGIGSFTSTLEDLDPNTIYYVRAYAVSNVGIVYGDEVSFTTVNSNNTGGHSYVDLGLPSGILRLLVTWVRQRLRNSAIISHGARPSLKQFTIGSPTNIAMALTPT